MMNWTLAMMNWTKRCALVLIVAAVFACGDDEESPQSSKSAVAVPEPVPMGEVESVEEEEEEPLSEEALLEAACFEGDREACDQLGH